MAKFFEELEIWMDAGFMKTVLEAIHKESIRHQMEMANP
jgi:hypothetical protein